MKIAYIIHGYSKIPSSVLRKIQGQVSCWQDSEINVALFVLVKNSDVLKTTLNPVEGISLNIETYRGKLDRFRVINRLWKKVEDWRPELLYHRYDLYHPSITRLAVRCPLVLEINTDDTREYKTDSKLLHILNLMTRGKLLRAASGLSFVSGELCRLECFSGYNKLSAIIANAVNLSEIDPLPPATNNEPRLIFIGSNRYQWHGVDRLLALAGQFPDWLFDIVGTTEADLFVDLPPNVLLHGYMEPPVYRELMKAADVAVGSLALERLGIAEASPLKHREYLACGLPIIAACKDTDFLEPVDFILELKSDFDPGSEMTCNRIAQFVNNWKGRRVPRERVEHLDVTAKESMRIEFFKKVLSSRGS